ncbi:hypothetical protein E2320_022058 [Naja naja]|nr:hypothetical protein E2320_022058 [Naja naja]
MEHPPRVTQLQVETLRTAPPSLKNEVGEVTRHTNHGQQPSQRPRTIWNPLPQAQCYLACHKKCLETLAIQCGHKKLQGKLQIFGRDFAQASHSGSDGVPFIVKKCISEIERRAMKTKGIYRVNGVKSRVEKLCQAFENGKELVELSQASPHDISNVLKLYLRQLPEPIMPFRMYNSLMGLAKETLQSRSDSRTGRSTGEPVDMSSETEKAMVTKLKELLKELPAKNLATLKCITQHLKRSVALPGKIGSENDYR